MSFAGQPVATTVYNKLRNPVGYGKSIKVVVPQSTTIEGGKFYLLDNILGCAFSDIVTAAGETSEVALNIDTAEYETGQIDTTDTFAKGSKVYWDSGNSRFTTVATDGIFAGVVTVAKDANNVIWFVLACPQNVAKQAAAVDDVASDDGVAAAGDAPNAAEFDAVVLLANETKEQLNAALIALRAAGLMAE